MQIYRPLISNSITQTWNQNKACVYPRGTVVSKHGGVCPEGSVDFYKSIGMIGHSGIDFSSWRGEQIYHAGDYAGWMKTEKDFQGGIGVDVISNEPQLLKDGRKEYIKLRYWHLKAPVGYDGKQVKLGEVIGLADSTGASSADHLHFGMKVCEKDGTPKERGNGWNGAMDPTPYMDMTLDAKSASEFLYKESPPLSAQEKKEMLHELSLASRLLQLLLELKRLM